MNAIKTLGLLSVCLGAAFASAPASAQTTDGYHSIQIFPIVVDNTSFAQRFNFRNPNSAPVTINTKFFPSTTVTATQMTCNPVVVQPGKTAMVRSLRDLCPGMAAGTQFGYLYTSETSGANLPYAAFSRVSNPLGNGFTVEAFPAHTFTSADVVVNGIRRLAAQNGQPAFQTNCFVGNLNDITPANIPYSTPIHYTIYDSTGNVIGQGDLSLAPGQDVRLSDIFATGLAPPGDYDDASIKFEELGIDEPGLMAFCTVQDNAFFGADFRVAKQESGAGVEAYPGDIVGGQDNHVARETLNSIDMVGRNFAIGTGVSSNTHVVYFRHPDYVQCEIIDPATGVRALPGYGLEMRMLDTNGLLVAGGNNSTGFGEVYLGDKTDRNSGANTRYRIEIEDSETNTGSTRPYKLHCQSGSGHSLGDIIRYQEAIGRF